MPTSPTTPTHGRRPSNVDLSFASPSHFDSHSRKSSLHSPVTPRPGSSQAMSGFTGMQNDFASPNDGGGNGLGSLADELADAWDEDEEGDEGDGEGEGDEADEGDPHGLQRDELDGMNDSGGVETPSRRGMLPSGRAGSISSPTPHKAHRESVDSPNEPIRARHSRKASRYDGSDYGHESDLDEAADIPSTLEARMAAIESLARRGTEENGGEADGVVGRLVEGLRDLGGQAGVEGGATRYLSFSAHIIDFNPTAKVVRTLTLMALFHRLITAHTALSTHLAHQTRTLHSRTFPLLSPLSIGPDPECIDELLPLITAAAAMIPQPSTSALTSLSQLSSLTSDLVQTLNYLSDSLHMSRQTTTTATRRLRSARELVAEMRKETEAKEEGVRWIEKGRWQTRLGERECAGVCREVVGGFEEVCQGWRDRLASGAELSAAR
ncbi:MAG: hypothetical protein M1819_006426 [Sarea resinae]|nr:MAG: hypothetical protein M1819_006426 [Sarea resinae]